MPMDKITVEYADWVHTIFNLALVINDGHAVRIVDDKVEVPADGEE